MSFIGALGNNTDDNNYNFNFNDLKIRIVDIDTSNYARFLDSNSSNYTEEIGLNSSNYTDVIGIHSSNYTDVISFNSSNYTDVVDNYSSNYTERINQELSDRIGYPAPLFPVEIPTGVYFPLKQQELIIADVGRIVGLHTTAITGIEQQIIGLVGVEGGAVGIVAGAVTLAGEAYTKANQAISTANTAKSTAETATITAEETQTIAERAEGKADTALTIWNKGTGANINNVYHLQTGNVGIGVSNDTELTHKLVVNGTTKLNDDVLLSGQLIIKETNDTPFINFYNYSDATTINTSAYIYLSNFSSVFAIDAFQLPIELRISGDPIIQVYSDKVDITKNLNVSGDINFTGNLYQNNELFTSGGGGSGGTGGTIYDDTNRLNYEYLRVPTGEGESIVNINEPIIQPTNIQEPTIDLFIQEPTSSPSVAKTTINSDYKYMSFVINNTPNIVYDFISKNTFADWKNYADTIPNATYDLTTYDSSADGLYKTNDPVGFFQIILPSTHTRLSITWGNAYNNPSGQPNATTSLIINGVVVDSISNIIQTKVYNYNYTGTPTVRVNEEYSLMTANMIINLQNPTRNTYSINFPEQTQCDILIVAGGGGGGTSYSSGSAAPAGGGGAGGLIFLENQTVSSGTYNILVGKGGDGDTDTDTSTPQRGKQGDNSSFSYYPTSSVGGGGGGSREGNEDGGDGGSGGGSGWGDPAGSKNGGSGVSGQGFAGGSSRNSGDVLPYASGGGGAGEVGHANNDSDNAVDGDGGIGKYSVGTFNFKVGFGLPVDNTLGEFFNGNVYFAGGGSSGISGSNTSFGGKGGGANSSGNVSLLNGMSNTGGGGAGSRASSNGRTNGGNGGSGVVIIRYKYTKAGTLQPITINSDYKYFSFPRLDNTLYSTTLYSMNFFENTEVELLILSNARFKVIPAFIVIPSGKINIYVGGSGSNSSFGSISTAGETTPYNSYNSAITGTTISYNQAIVIVRYKYTRPIIQPITIDNHYKYISFPNYGTNQTPYSLNFQENTEVQLLLLDGLKYIENAPFTTSGNTTINVGVPSTFNTITTNTNSTFYNFSTGHLSTITGVSAGYNSPIVIVRYKYTKIIISQVTKYGFLQYNNNNVWDVEPVATVANILPLLNSNHFEEITNKIALKNFDNSGRFNYEKLSNPGSAGSLVYDNATNWHMQEELIFYVGSLVREENDPNPGFGVVVQEELKLVGLEIKNAEWGKLYITTNPQGKPQYTTDISNGAGSGYMVNHLEVDGKIAGKEYKLSNGSRFAYSGQSDNPTHGGTSRGLECEHFDGLHIRGTYYYGINCQGNLSTTGTKQFKIPHPILENKSLVHNSVESPRVENLYRGIKQLINGKCEINIDTDCNENGGLTEGTYQSFNRHPQLFLQNHNTFDRLKGIITGNRINVICEDDTANYEINWMVISERCDKNIMETTTTDDNGRLLCEVENTDTGAENA
jgi:hypothetical protein